MLMQSRFCRQSRGKGLILRSWHADKGWLGHCLPRWHFCGPTLRPPPSRWRRHRAARAIRGEPIHFVTLSQWLGAAHWQAGPGSFHPAASSHRPGQPAGQSTHRAASTPGSPQSLPPPPRAGRTAALRALARMGRAGSLPRGRGRALSCSRGSKPAQSPATTPRLRLPRASRTPQASVHIAERCTASVT